MMEEVEKAKDREGSGEDRTEEQKRKLEEGGREKVRVTRRKIIRKE